MCARGYMYRAVFPPVADACRELQRFHFEPADLPKIEKIISEARRRRELSSRSSHSSPRRRRRVMPVPPLKRRRATAELPPSQPSTTAAPPSSQLAAAAPPPSQLAAAAAAAAAPDDSPPPRKRDRPTTRASRAAADDEAFDAADAAQTLGECTVCLDRTARVAMVPCGHVVLCAQCCRALREKGGLEKCCICRREVENTVAIRL